MLYDAIVKNNENNVKVILDANFPPNLALNSLGITSLQLACCSSNANIINLIIGYSPTINTVDTVTICFLFIYL
jgi:hypothetical protein